MRHIFSHLVFWASVLLLGHHGAVMSSALTVSSGRSECCHKDCQQLPSGYKVADSCDCRTYYICNGAMMIPLTCCSDMIFSMELQTCINGTCNETIATTQTPTKVTASPTETTQTATTNTASTTSKTTPRPEATDYPPPVCTFNMHGMSFPDEHHCRFFWECVHNVAYKRYCERGMWWDRVNAVCHYPERVKNCPCQCD